MSRGFEGSPGFGMDGVLKPHPHILVADNDPATGRLLQLVLESKRYRVRWCRSVGEAVHMAVELRPDVIVQELDFPEGSGFDLLERVREWGDIPVVVLTARSAIADKVLALDSGASDYVVKPFAPEELAARLRVHLRTEQPKSDGPVLVVGPLRMNLALREVSVAGRLMKLTGTEEAVLAMLARYAGMLVPRERLLRAIWGGEAESKRLDLQVHISNLRRKFKECTDADLIRSEGSLGYSLTHVPAPHETIAGKL